MFLLRVLLFPFAVLYGFITWLRNRLYDLELKPSTGFEVPVISVGNLTVGGTGKTPMIEHLVRNLGLEDDAMRLAILSRGYGRRTRGFRIAGAADNASTLGDEPFQFYRKFGNKVIVAVGEDRAFAIPGIVDQDENVQAILLDDAYQHRRVKPLFSILLTDYHHPFYKDYMLPAGRLRESRKGADRADIVVVTKCPADLSEETMMEVSRRIRSYTSKPVFFASIHYGHPLPLGAHTAALQEEVILVTGIADARPLKSYVERNFRIVKHFNYRDHHRYSVDDIQAIRQAAGKQISILTTEKDMVKLDDPQFATALAGLSLFYIPIEIDFIKNGKDFDALVRNAITSYKKEL